MCVVESSVMYASMKCINVFDFEYIHVVHKIIHPKSGEGAEAAQKPPLFVSPSCIYTGFITESHAQS